VNDTTTAPRWDLFLPLIAAGVAGMMMALAFLSLYAFRQREALALDGRIFGLAHDAELRLRESGREAPGKMLEEILAEGQPEVLGLVLSDPNGAVLATAGSETNDFGSRTVDLFVGPGLRGGSEPPGPPPERWTRGQAAGPRGRGRLVLEFILDPSAGSPPWVIRLLLPAAIAVSVGLIGLAFLGGRLLVRQRYDALREAQQRRLEALARAGAGLAHQLRTPLATIKGSCQLMSEQLEQSPQRARLQTAINQAKRMERMLEMLLDFARPPAQQPQATEIPGLLQDVAAHRSRVQLGRIDEAIVNADPEHLAQIIDNLVDNAEAFSTTGEPVEIATILERDRIEIIVADRGPGPGPDPEELFQPYVTTRADGTGLGLAIARTLAEANNGNVTLRTREGGGCEAVLTLPIVRGNS
jgi:signal transduction histidine kinase